MNKIKIKNVFAFLLLMLFVLNNVTYAEEKKDEWQNNNYDKTKIKRVLIRPVKIADGIVLDTFDGIRINAYCEEIKNNKEIKKNGASFLTEKDLAAAIDIVVQEDMNELAKTDSQKYQELLQEYTGQFVDQVLEYNLLTYRTDKIYVPERIYQETEYVDTVVISKKKGTWEEEKTIVKMPVERLKVEPAHFISIANTGIKAVLTDYKSKENIWMIMDMRESEYKGLLPMSERICKRIEDKFVDLLK